MRMRSILPHLLLTATLTFLGGNANLHAQAGNKKLEKAVERFKNGEMDEAIADTRKLLGGKDDEEVWTMLIEMYQYRYQNAVSRAASGRPVGGAATPQACRNDLIDAAREATYAIICPRANQYLRNLLVDVDPDTVRVPAAAEAMQKAEKAFGAKEYGQAIKEYRNVLKVVPTHYKATMYIGDCFYFLRQQDSAMAYFRKAIAMQPRMLEPRKYLVDALGSSRRNEEALEEAARTFIIYPDEAMFEKVSDAAERLNKRMERGWIKRGVTVDQLGADQDPGKGPWKRYRDAKTELAPFCNAQGVVDKPGAPEGARYLEVHAWHRMLAGNDLPKEMAHAKRMEEAGYLDCYVFLCLFHHDLYEQYRAFADAEGDRIVRFISGQLVH